jgi:signal transduction histidine kinase/ligand-binding sensor domain-containing protein
MPNDTPYLIFVRKAIKLVCALLFLVFPEILHTQVLPPDFQFIRGPANFILGKITGITQDKRGYIWMAEQRTGCLTRFDGYTFKRYYHVPGNANSLYADNVEGVAADSSGHIWITWVTANIGGVDRFDPVSETFTHFASDQKEVHGLSARFVSEIMVDHRGVVWVGTSDGLFRFDEKTNTFKQYVHRDGDKNSLSNNLVRCLYEDRSGTIWVGTGLPFALEDSVGGLNRLDPETGQFTQYLHNPSDPGSLINNKVRAIFEDSRGRFWVGTQGDGLHLMDRKTGRFKRMTYDRSNPDALSRTPPNPSEPYDHITFITEDVTGSLWIGTYSEGLIRYDTALQKITRFKSESSRPNGFKDSTSWCSFISRDGTLWISTENGNLYTVDPRRTQFIYHEFNAWYWALYEENPNTLWAAENGFSLAKLHRQGNQLRIDKVYQLPNKEKVNGRITDIFPVDLDKFRVSSFYGLYAFSKKDGQFHPMGLWDSTLGKPVVSMETIEPLPGVGFYTVGLGLARINASGKLEKIFRKNPNDPDAISSDTLVSAAFDGDHTLYIGTISGLSSFDLSTEKFRHSLHSILVYKVLIQRGGDVWAATNNGLYRKHKDSANFRQISSYDPDIQLAQFYGLTEDALGMIWGPSSLGIFRINPRNESINVYGLRSGITQMPTSARSKPMTLSDGTIAIGSLGGIYTFTPGDIFNEIAPIIHIQALQVGKKENSHPYLNEPQKDLDSLAQIRLKHFENTFTVSFTGIHFNDLHDNVIEYKLENFDENWNKTESEPSASYFNLQPGNYVFRVRARSSYGVWAEKSIPLIVLPPWWQTWWAYTLYIILLLAGIWGFIRWRTQALHKEKQVLENRVRERTRELEKEKAIVEETLTELKTTQSQLIQSEKMASLGELTAGIAHEIQNPLNFVNNFSEISQELIDEMHLALSQGDTDVARKLSSEVSDNLQKILTHGKRADSIVKNMLQHSRSSSGQKEATDVNALADEFLRLAFQGLRARDKSFNARMVTHFDKNLGKIPVIAQDLGRVLLNLFNNAFYAVQEKARNSGPDYQPTVTVRTRYVEGPAPVYTPGQTNAGTRKGTLHITIEDNGIGIQEKNMDKIFQPFFTTKPTGEGTGLGLSLSYDIITKGHGGSLTVSTRPGEGSIFTITLPA